MAAKERDTLPFDTLRLEGALFVPDLLERIARGEYDHQRPADYQVPRGLRLHDEYGRAFQIGRAQFQAFRRAADGGDDGASRRFIAELLRDALGYTDLQAPGFLEVNDRRYPVQFLGRGRVPVIVAPARLGLDDADPMFAVEGSGARRRSAFRLAQELLNASPECLWAMATNGRQLRLLRDAATLTRPCFLEFDLETIFTDARYPDFAALWRILHASRAGAAGEPAERCIWERWRQAGQTKGIRVRDGLRHSVTQALIILGEGFLRHPANEELRRSLLDGELSADDFFQELLRLVYRCLFLFTLEERGLLHPEDDSPAAAAARAVYAEGYSMRRLRRRLLQPAGDGRHHDLWQGLTIVFTGLARGEERLALPALGGLFRPDQCPTLDRCQLANRHFLAAIRSLRWAVIDNEYAFVDYRNMGPEELGSVYESLLELVPVVDVAARSFSFAGLGEEGGVAGHARKTTGSYYTPDSLVQELVRSALDPVIEGRGEAELLATTVIDPACGSGHFLLAAARRLAERLAELRAADRNIRPEDYRHALRQVIANCIYGVDKNPMALELARTALWLEGYEPGRPLSFLDHHLVCGDALLGLVDLDQLEAGIPDAAYKCLSGDDADLCRQLTRQNRQGRKVLQTARRQKNLFTPQVMEDLDAQRRRLAAMPDTTPEEVTAKEAAHRRLLEQTNASRLLQAADLFTGAFLLPKNANTPPPPTSHDLAGLLTGTAAEEPPTLAAAAAACRRERVLHWPLAFPEVFARGGFDCVLANPPWKMLQLDPKKFFAATAPEIANAKHMAAREKAIKRLKEESPNIYQDYIDNLRLTESIQNFIHNSERFPYSGTGRINLSSLFTETSLNIISSIGRVGIIVPSGIATDSFTKKLFNHINNGNLLSLFDFENREGLFPDVHRSYKFCLLTLGKSEEAWFAFFLTDPAQLADQRRTFTLTPHDFRRLNPNTRTCPVFRSRMDAELTRRIYSRVPVLLRDAHNDTPEANPWNIRFMLMFMMNTDSKLFADQGDHNHLPLYEAKMIHQFDHRWASYQRDEQGKATIREVSAAEKGDPAFTVQPRYWVDQRQVLARIARVPRAVAQAYAAGNGDGLLAGLANWVEAWHEEIVIHQTPAASRRLLVELAGPIFTGLPADPGWRQDRIKAEARDLPPLTGEELAILRSAGDLWQAADHLLDHRSPRWLMGWRDICRATDERTVIAAVLPRVGVGDTLLLMFPDPAHGVRLPLLLADQCSLVHDFVVRQKVGGTHLKYHVKKQLPVLPPDAYTQADIDFIVPRVLALTYTSHDLLPWAGEIWAAADSDQRAGWQATWRAMGLPPAASEPDPAAPPPPFPFDSDLRARIRAELDAYYGRLYGLTRDEMRYILDPAEVMGDDYPSETFRVLKNNELRRFGEYRTRRLVLEAWDRLATL